MLAAEAAAAAKAITANERRTAADRLGVDDFALRTYVAMFACWKV